MDRKDKEVIGEVIHSLGALRARVEELAAEVAGLRSLIVPVSDSSEAINLELDNAEVPAAEFRSGLDLPAGELPEAKLPEAELPEVNAAGEEEGSVGPESKAEGGREPEGGAKSIGEIKESKAESSPDAERKVESAEAVTPVAVAGGGPESKAEGGGKKEERKEESSREAEGGAEDIGTMEESKGEISGKEEAKAESAEAAAPADDTKSGGPEEEAPAAATSIFNAADLFGGQETAESCQRKTRRGSGRPAVSGMTVGEAFSIGSFWETDRPGTEVRDIKSAISLNDRVLFLSTLFRSDHLLYQDTLSKLNTMRTLDEAVKYLWEVFPEWKPDSEEVGRFMMAVRRKLR